MLRCSVIVIVVCVVVQIVDGGVVLRLVCCGGAVTVLLLCHIWMCCDCVKCIAGPLCCGCVWQRCNGDVHIVLVLPWLCCDILLRGIL